MSVRVFLLTIALSGPALAYIDPVTGNLLVQAVLVLAAGVAMGYHRVKGYVSSLFGREKPREKDEDSGEPQKTEKSEKSIEKPVEPNEADG